MRWIVDAMNVIGCRPDGWWRDRRAATARLVDRLERWAVRDGVDVTVVLERPPTPELGSDTITIAHAPAARADSADDEIVRLLHRDPHPEQIVVVTSDRVLAQRVTTAGASVYPAHRLRDEIDPR